MCLCLHNEKRDEEEKRANFVYVLADVMYHGEIYWIKKIDTKKFNLCKFFLASSSFCILPCIQPDFGIDVNAHIGNRKTHKQICIYNVFKHTLNTEVIIY